MLTSKKAEFDAAADHLRKDLSSLRTGRANPVILEGITVSAYDSKMDLKSVASITIQDAKTMLVDPWDKGLLQTVEKAIRDADIGVNPAVDGHVIRINLPPMTEETRVKLVKQVNEKAEDARVRVRGLREKIRDEVNKMEKEKELSEDEKFKILEELDKLTKDYTALIDEIGDKKETEIMTV